ncbi:RDD family protein [Streptomyces sp. NPDC014734]|uniref:RDD family protein n=1 Tax=Streptomyces sp. NPDC014734 TaxID=3364886 RepID=UPI0036F94F8D
MNELVTGDAVVLGLRPAKLPSRMLALAIDLVVVGAAFVLVLIGLVLAVSTLDEAAVAAISLAAFLLVLVGGPIAVETLSHGRSLGKLVCGLRVVRDDGGPIRFRHAMMRGAMGVVEILMTFGVIACVASLVSERGRRLGDVFAGTLVVRERVPAGRAAAVPPPPPWLVGRFAALDLSGVPDGLWLAIRQYLTRVHQLDARIGGSMAERLAGELAARTGVPVPPGVPAGAYLAAVVHERQARDARRVLDAGRDGAAPGTADAGRTDRRGQAGRASDVGSVEKERSDEGPVGGGSPSASAVAAGLPGGRAGAVAPAASTPSAVEEGNSSKPASTRFAPPA